jgi:hypothetical protein
MRLFVEDTVPVLVEVDVEHGAVVSARVDDESVEGPAGVVADDIVPTTDQERLALTLPEDEAWPGWTFGV